jgi:uncharacterized protein YbaA (DUF1428 family)
MANYVDGFITPVPVAKIADYKKMSRLAGKVFIEHGALSFCEAMADDVKPGKWTSFPQSVKLKTTEVVWLSWITFKSRAHRDRVNAKVMADPRLAKLMNPKNVPFDGKRMIWGGFKTMIQF